MIGIGFLICVFGIGIINLLLPSKKISEEENRGLQQKPELSVSAVTSGSYMDQYEKYQADQFMGRNMWRSLKVGFSRLAGSKEENGVFIGKKGQLLEDIAVPDQDVLKANMKAIQSFSQKYSDIPVNMLLVPDAANILSDRLPFTATVADQSQYIAQVKKELGDSARRWLNHCVVIKHEFKNFLLCLIVKPQPIQNLFCDITAWYPMTVEVPTVFIFSVALWLSDVVE